MDRLEQIAAWERGDLYPEHDTFSFGHGFGTGLIEETERAAVERAIEVLNRLHAADPTVLPALIAHRVPCNEAAADDPTVQVGHIDDDRTKGCEVGLLGIVNGLFGVQGPKAVGFICAHYDDDHELTHFAWNVLPEPAPLGPRWAYTHLASGKPSPMVSRSVGNPSMIGPAA